MKNLTIKRTSKYVVSRGNYYYHKYLWTCVNPYTEETMFRYAFHLNGAKICFERAVKATMPKPKTKTKLPTIKKELIPLDTLLTKDIILTNTT